MIKKSTILFIGIALLLSSCGKAVSPTEAARKAVKLARQGDLKGAEKVLQDAHEDHENNPNIIYLLAQVNLMQKKEAQAFKLFESGIKRIKDKASRVQLISYYARFLASNDKSQQAEKVLQQGMKIDPSNRLLLETKRMLSVAVGKQAPELTSKNILTGRKVSLSSFKGKVVLIDFWASWCGPCRQSLPHLVDIYKKFARKGLVVVGVNLDRTKKAALSFIRKQRLPFLNLFDKKMNQKVSNDYNVRGIPATFLIDKKGIIRYNGHPMQLNEKAIEKLL